MESEYGYLIVHTHNGVVKTTVAPSEFFNLENIHKFVDTLDGVTGWVVREIDSYSSVVSMEEYRKRRAESF